MSAKVVVLYMPVIHQGYLNFLSKYQDAAKWYVLSSELLKQDDTIRKDIRALPTAQVVAFLRVFDPQKMVQIINEEEFIALGTSSELIVMPDEELTRKLTEKYWPNTHVHFDTTFLRWDSKKAMAAEGAKPDNVIKMNAFMQKIFGVAYKAAEKSADWWRQVGGVIVKDEKILFTAYNHHVPSELQPYFDGDPRASFHKGVAIELSTAQHAEAGLIATAAKEGISLRDAEIYLTTFPCPPCAKLVAYSGIRKVYFTEGYAMLDGESVLKANGVEITKVDLNQS